jgi:hypothetical protein
MALIPITSALFSWCKPHPRGRKHQIVTSAFAIKQKLARVKNKLTHLFKPMQVKQFLLCCFKRRSAIVPLPTMLAGQAKHQSELVGEY